METIIQERKEKVSFSITAINVFIIHPPSTLYKFIIAFTQPFDYTGIRVHLYTYYTLIIHYE